MLGEIKIGESGLLDPETTSRMGKIQGVDYIIYGAVTGASTEYDRNLKCMSASISVTYNVTEVETGRLFMKDIISGSGVAVNAKEAIFNAMESTASGFLKNMTARFPLMGKIILVKENYVWVNLGARNGVDPNTEFILDGASDPDFPEEAGKPLGIARILEIRDDKTKIEPGYLKKINPLKQDWRFDAELLKKLKVDGRVRTQNKTEKKLFN